MSGVLHPVGPEEPETYWGRRVAIVVVVAVLAGLLTWLLVGSGGDQQTAPANPPPTPTPTATALGSSPTSSPSTTPADTSSPAATETPSANADSPSAASTKTASPSAAVGSSSPSATRSAKPATVTCNPAKLRSTLTGQKKISTGDKLAFDLSLINGTGVTCRLSVNPDRFELKVYSGTDRVWSSADCTSQVQPQTRVLKPEQAIEWTMKWNTERSAKQCKTKPGTQRPGVYVATAAYQGAKPVQLVMNLR